MTTQMFKDFLDFIQGVFSLFLDMKIYPFVDSTLYFTFGSMISLMCVCIFIGLLYGIIHLGNVFDSDKRA